MSKFKNMDTLAEALESNGWSDSKSTDKVIAIMSGLGNVPWDKVKLFTLRWSLSAGVSVPDINLLIWGDGEEGEPKIDVEIPDEEE